MLHSTLAPENSLTAYAVASSPSALLLRHHLVADRFRAGGRLFRFHLATLCRKSQRPARQPRFLLGAQ